MESGYWPRSPNAEEYGRFLDPPPGNTSRPPRPPPPPTGPAISPPCSGGDDEGGALKACPDEVPLLVLVRGARFPPFPAPVRLLAALGEGLSLTRSGPFPFRADDGMLALVPAAMSGGLFL